MRTFNLKSIFLTGLASVACAFGLHAADLTWDPLATTTGSDGPGTWDAASTLWANGTSDQAWDNVTPTNAIFGSTSGTAGAVTVLAGQTINVGNITFNTPNAGNYNLAPGDANSRLSFIPSSVVTVASGLVITNTVLLAGTSSFTKSGPGTFSIRPSAANQNTGTTMVTDGTLVMGSSGNRVVIPGDLIVTNTGDARLGAANTIASTATVSVASGATFEMNGNALGVTSFILNGGTVTQTSTEALATPNFDARSGAISQSGGTGKLDVSGTLTKSTSGTVTLTGRGSATGSGILNTVVNDGTLILDYTQSPSKLTDVTGTLTINGGTLTFTNGNTTEAVGTVTLISGVITNAGGTSKLSVPAGSYDVQAGAVYTVLAGVASLTKTTPGTVVLANTNTYTGGTVISDGILQLGDGNFNGTLSTSGGAMITDNSVLVLNPGAGGANYANVITGSGSLIKIGGGTASLTQPNSYQGSTTISNGILTIDSDATLGDGTGTLTLAGGNLSSTAGRTAASAPVASPINLVADSVIGTTSTSATVDFNLSSDSITGSAGTLTFSNSAASGTGIFQPRFSGSGFNFSRPIVIANGGNGSSTTRLDSYNLIGTTQTFSGAISGNGGFRRNASINHNGGNTVFSANNSYTGGTEVNQGFLFVNGSLGDSVVSVGLTGSMDGTLGGNGVIAGAVTVGSGGTLAPGAAIGTIGQLTINNSLSLSGQTTVDVNKNGAVRTQDSVAGLTSVTFGGDLIVNATGDTLVAGDSFQLFNIGGTGNFNTITPDPGAGLTWSFNPVTGALSVTSASAAPVLNVSQSGNTLTFSWTGTYKLQSQTNGLSGGLDTNWTDYPDTSDPVGVAIDPANPAVFFRLSK